MICSRRRFSTAASCALSLCLLMGSGMVDRTHGQGGYPVSVTADSPYASASPVTESVYPMTATAWAPDVIPAGSEALPPGARVAANDSWIEPTLQEPSYVDADVYLPNGPVPGQPMVCPSPDAWFWQVLPEGLIYRSYWAGVHEPRMGLFLFNDTNSDNNSFWDATLGGRVGLLRYGNGAVLFPQGWELDFEGAALPRLTLDRDRDLESVDFRAGIPLTYGIDCWQFKFGYYHLSSHMGDEFAIREDALGDRINYVRDALVLGASYYPDPMLRLYAEASYAFNVDGGAEPWEFQVGAELSRSGPTGSRGSPFLAVNGQFLEEHNYGGALTAQAGWMWRGLTGQTLRIGAQYYNGKSSQYQTFDNFEQQIGGGIWYDF